MIRFGCIKNGDSGEYVGRACYGYPESPLHNPFKLGKADDIREILKAYRQHLLARIQAGDPGIIKELTRLKALAQQGDMTLLCWCKKGYPCHAHVIAEILETFVMPQKTLFLVDSFAHIYRSYYANPNLTNGAAFFFTRVIQALVRAQKPTHLACVFDTNGGSHHRYALHPDYKQGRASRPQELDVQIPLVKKICGFMGWNPIEFSGAEADDVLATLALRAVRQGFTKIVLVTPDKDLCQLVDNTTGISVLTHKEGVHVILDEAGVKHRLGVAPHQVVDYLTLLGDASDNVKGVDGIGEKGAAGILGAHQHLEGALANLARLRPAHRTGMEQASHRLSLSRELVTVQKDLDLPIDIETFRLSEPDAAAQTKFFTELDFKSLAPNKSLDDMDMGTWLSGGDELPTAGPTSGPTFDDVEGL